MDLKTSNVIAYTYSFPSKSLQLLNYRRSVLYVYSMMKHIDII